MNKLYMDILWNWRHATDTERNKIKKWLMPEDDIKNLIFKVTDHPIFRNGQITYHFFEIEVQDICHIIVDDNRIHYEFYH